MEQLQLLDAEAHRALRMHGAPVDHPPFVMITLGEIAAAAAVCPVFLAKDRSTGQFYVGAMFGFQAGQLLVEGAAQGRPAFRPLELQRQGFFISGENIALQPDHPRFGPGADVPLFDGEGGPADAMRAIQKALGALKGGVDATAPFLRTMVDLKLVEPLDVSLSFDDGEKLRLDGLYTISRDAMNELADDAIVTLFRKGYLQAAQAITLSQGQLAVLARRRNARWTEAL